MSENNNISTLFDRSGNLTPNAMERYLAGKMTPEECLLVDKHLADSDFDREALEGYRKNLSANLGEDISGLNEKIGHMAAKHSAQTKSRRINPYYWVAAAGFLIIASLTTLLVFMFRNTIQAPELAVNRQDTLLEKQVESISPVADTFINEEVTDELAAIKPQAEEQIVKIEENVDEVETATPRPSAPQQMIIVEDEIAVDNETDLIVNENTPSEVPTIGGVLQGVNAGAAASKQKRNAKASYTIQADEAMRMQERNSNAEEAVGPDTTIYSNVEQKPEFPGGDEAFLKFIADNLHYPDSAKAKGIQGRVFVTFVVEFDGSISNVNILRGIGGGCDEEAVRVMKMMPAWVPGMQRGEPVRVQYNLPIKFTLE